MPKLVVAAGLHRSGSTWLYNVLRYCYLNAGCRTYSDFTDGYDPSVKADVHVVKTHLFIPELQKNASYIVTSYRDLRDVIASLLRRKLIENTVEEIAHTVELIIEHEYDPWKAYAHLAIKYENMINDTPAAIASILQILQLDDVDPHEVHRDVEMLSRIVTTQFDPSTQIWPDHFTDGRAHSYAETLSPAAIMAIEAVGGDWLRQHGYC